MIKLSYCSTNKETKKRHKGKKRKFNKSNPIDSLEFFDVISKTSPSFQNLLASGKIIQSPNYQIWCQCYKSTEPKSILSLIKLRELDLAKLELSISEGSRPEVPIIPTLTDKNYSNLLFATLTAHKIPIKIQPENLTREYWLQLTSTLNNSNSLSTTINNILISNESLHDYVEATIEVYKDKAHLSQLMAASEHKIFFRQLAQILAKHPNSDWRMSLPIESIAKLSSIVTVFSAITNQPDLFMNVPYLIEIYFRATGIETKTQEYIKIFSDLAGIDLMWVRRDKRTFDAFRNQLQVPSEFMFLKHYFLYFQQDLEIAYSLWKTPFEQKALSMNSAQTLMVLTEMEFCKHEQSQGFLASNNKFVKTAKRFTQTFLPSNELLSALKSLISTSGLTANKLWFYTRSQDLSLVRALFPFAKLEYKTTELTKNIVLFDPSDASSLFFYIGQSCITNNLIEIVELPELKETECFLIVSNVEVRRSLLHDQLSTTFKTNCFDFWDPREEIWKRMNSSFCFMVSSLVETKDINIKSESYNSKVKKLKTVLETVKLSQLDSLSNKIKLLGIPLSLLNREIILTLKASISESTGEPFDLTKHSYQIIDFAVANEDYKVTINLKNKTANSHNFISSNPRVEIQFSLFQTTCSFTVTIPKKEDIIPNKYIPDSKAKLQFQTTNIEGETYWSIKSNKYNIFSIDKCPENIPYFEMKSPFYVEKDKFGTLQRRLPSFPSLYHELSNQIESDDSSESNESPKEADQEEEEEEEEMAKVQNEFLQDWDQYSSDNPSEDPEYQNFVKPTNPIFSKSISLKMKSCYLNLKNELSLNLGKITKDQLVKEGNFYFFNSQNDVPLEICQSRMLILHLIRQKQKNATCPWWSLELPFLTIELDGKLKYLCPFLFPTKSQDLLEIPASIYSIKNEFFVHAGGKAYIAHKILDQENNKLSLLKLPDFRFVNRGFNQIYLTDTLMVKTWKVIELDPHHNETPLNPFRIGKVYFSPLDFIETMHLVIFKTDNDFISYSPQNTMISEGKFVRNITIERTGKCIYDRKSFADWNFKQLCENKRIFISRQRVLLKFETSSTKLSDIHHDLIQFLLSIPLGKGESIKILDNPADGIFLESDKLTKEDLKLLEENEKSFLSKRECKFLEIKTSSSPYTGTRNISKFIYNDMEKIVVSPLGIEFSSSLKKRLKQTKIPGTSVSYLELLMSCNKREFDFRLNSPHLRLDNISKMSFQDRKIWGPSDTNFENTSSSLYEKNSTFLQEPNKILSEYKELPNLEVSNDQISLRKVDSECQKICKLEDFDKFDFENMRDDDLDKIDFDLPEPPPEEPNYRQCKHYPSLEQQLDLLKDSIVNKKLMVKEIFKASPINWFKAEKVPDGKGGWREMTKEELEEEYGDFDDFDSESEQ